MKRATTRIKIKTLGSRIVGTGSGRKRSAPLIFSFFSGAGFLDLGFEKAGFEIGYVNEIHKPFRVFADLSRSFAGQCGRRMRSDMDQMSVS